MSSDESGVAEGGSQESYCMVTTDDIPEAEDLLHEKEEEAIRRGQLQVEDDLIRRLERLKSPVDDILDFEDDDCPAYGDQPQWRPISAAWGMGGAVERARGFDDTLEDVANKLNYQNSADIRLHQSVIKPLVREAASLNLLEGTSACLEDQSSDRKHSNPEIPRERPKITPRGIKPGCPPISINESPSVSDDDEVPMSPFSNRSPSPMASSEDEEAALSKSDEEAYEFLHQIGYSFPIVPVPLKVIKQAMQMHELESILNTYFLIGYEEGFRKSDLENHVGPVAANEVYRKLGVNKVMTSDTQERVTNKDSEVARPSVASDEIDRRFKELGFVDDEVLNDQVGIIQENSASASTENGDVVFHDARPDRGSSTALVQKNEFKDLTDVSLTQRELETAFGDWGKPAGQDSKKVAEISTEDWVRKCNQTDDNDDDTLTDESVGKDSRTSRHDISDKQLHHTHGRPSIQVRSTTEKSVQTALPRSRTDGDSFEIRGSRSMGTVPTNEQGVQTNLGRSSRSVQKTDTNSTSEQSSQTVMQIVDPTKPRNDRDPEDLEQTKTIYLEALAQEQLKRLKRVAEERDDLLEYLEAKEENWNKLGLRYQKEINTLRAFATHVISDKLASGRSLNRRTHTSLVRAKQNQDKTLALCFEQRNKISELQLQLSYQMKVTYEMAEELDAARTALDIHRGNIKINKTPELHKRNVKESNLYQVLTCDRAAYPTGTTDEPEMAVLDTFGVGGHRGISVEKLDQDEGDGLSVFECLSVQTMKDYVKNPGHKEENVEELTKSVEEMIRDRGALWML